MPPQPRYKENNTYFGIASSFGPTDGMRRSIYTEYDSQPDHEGVHRAWNSKFDLF